MEAQENGSSLSRNSMSKRVSFGQENDRLLSGPDETLTQPLRRPSATVKIYDSTIPSGYGTSPLRRIRTADSQALAADSNDARAQGLQPNGADNCVIALHEKADTEDMSVQVRFAVNVSIVVNVILSAATLYAVIRSRSLAVLASLIDTLLDLISQVILSFAESCMRRPSDEHYPAGRSRIEPVGIIIVSVLMGIAALELLRASIGTIIRALMYHNMPKLLMEPVTLSILCISVGAKCLLYFISSALASRSGTAQALAEDHKNDIMTNSFSVVSSAVAHYFSWAWFVDPIGAIVISSLIFWNWLHVGMQHATKVIGLSAPPETLEEISELADRHHPELSLDIIRAYHFGPNFLVELEVILPIDMTVQHAHDISLDLQQKVEKKQFVERCFVHVDYMHRDNNEHKI